MFISYNCPTKHFTDISRLLFLEVEYGTDPTGSTGSVGSTGPDGSTGPEGPDRHNLATTKV